MKLYEYEAAEIFAHHGIPVPNWMTASSPEETRTAAEKLRCPVVVKAQVLVGGRGLAGGVKTASSPEEALTVAETILGSCIHGLTVNKVMISQKIELVQEFYLGITVDGGKGQPIVVASSKGGMKIEEIAQTSPSRISSRHVDINRGLFSYEARNLLVSAGFPQRQINASADLLVKLFRVFRRYNALIAEINPLAVGSDGLVMALDAKLEIDDSALYRMENRLPAKTERIENPLEKKGREIGVTYVDLDGDIGLISSGAGLGMATMDIIGRKLRPANFLETGGGITEDLLYRTMELMMMKPGLRAIFINLYGGINPIQEGAKGVVRYIRDHNLAIPIVAKALGNRQEETWEILRSGGVHVVTETATEKAVEKLFELVKA
jgi:succinyl-CoA synthetase beta subunit